MYVDRLAAAAGCALDLAWAKAGATAPNPPVGCVLLDAAGDTLVAASHERAGAPHAEAAAIALCRAAGTLSRARAAVVTLEPCSHVGRTPPCVDALLATDIELFLVGARDPHSRAPGRGIERLERAGLRVLPFSALDHPEAPRLARSAARLIEPFASASRRGRPFVTVKTALTAEGSMIPPPGEKTFTSQTSSRRSPWISPFISGRSSYTGDGWGLGSDSHPCSLWRLRWPSPSHSNFSVTRPPCGDGRHSSLANRRGDGRAGRGRSAERGIRASAADTGRESGESTAVTAGSWGG